MVDSCLTCSQCQAGEEQFCKKGSTSTYGGADKHGRAGVPPGGPQHTLGGYTTKTASLQGSEKATGRVFAGS